MIFFFFLEMLLGDFIEKLWICVMLWDLSVKPYMRGSQSVQMHLIKKCFYCSFAKYVHFYIP